MKKFIVIMLLLSAMVLAVSPSAQDAKSTFRNGYAWSGNNKDNATAWAQAIEAQASVSGGQIGTGSVFYVDSGVSASGNGTSWSQAKSTIDAAINLCSASRGDYILVAQGHAETVSAANGFDADIAGITILGAGAGDLRPTITFDQTASDVAIGAANVTISGIRFLAGVSAVVRGISVEAAGDYLTLVDCEFPEPLTSSFEFVRAILVATGANYGSYIGNVAYSVDADGATNWLDLDTGVQTGTTVVGNLIMGDYDEGIIHSDDIDLEVVIANNILTNTDAGQHCIEFSANATGKVIDNKLQTDVITTALDNGTMSSHGNTWITPTADVEAVTVNPIADAVTNLIGVNDASNLGVTTSVTSDADGSVLERLEFLQYNTVATITATTDFTASTDVMFTVAGGAIEIISLFGQCTTLAAGSPGTMIIEVDATAGADYDSDLSTTVNVDALGAGDSIRFTNAIDEGVLTLTANVGAGQTLSWFAPAGDIEQTLSSTGTGAVKWYMTYRTLDTGVTVTAP